MKTIVVVVFFTSLIGSLLVLLTPTVDREAKTILIHGIATGFFGAVFLEVLAGKDVF